jgi:hypothetical protein
LEDEEDEEEEEGEEEEGEVGAKRKSSTANVLVTNRGEAVLKTRDAAISCSACKAAAADSDGDASYSAGILRLCSRSFQWQPTRTGRPCRSDRGRGAEAKSRRRMDTRFEGLVASLIEVRAERLLSSSALAQPGGSHLAG